MLVANDSHLDYTTEMTHRLEPAISNNDMPIRSPRRQRDIQTEMDRIMERDPENADFRYHIWSRELKATPVRIAVLRLLSSESEPISAADIYGKLGDNGNQATVYRALEALSVAGLIDRISLTAGRVLYEIGYGRKHHHHAICTSCGDIEDVKGCDEEDLNVTARASLKKFKRVESHSLEFFGVCKKCESI